MKKLVYLLTCLLLPLACLFVLLSMLAQANAAPPTAALLPIQSDYGGMETATLATPDATAKNAPYMSAVEIAAPETVDISFVKTRNLKPDRMTSTDKEALAPVARDDSMPRPPYVNIQVILESDEDAQYLDTVLQQFVKRDWKAAFYVTPKFAVSHPEVIKDLLSKKHELGVLVEDELLGLDIKEQVQRLGKALITVREAGKLPDDYPLHVCLRDYVVRYDDILETLRALESLGAASLTGVFLVGKDFSCPYCVDQSRLMYPLRTPDVERLVLIPVAAMEIEQKAESKDQIAGARLVLLDDTFFKLPTPAPRLPDFQLSDRLGHQPNIYLFTAVLQRYEGFSPLPEGEIPTDQEEIYATASLPYAHDKHMTILVHPSITGADETALGALERFLDQVAQQNGQLVTNAQIVDLTIRVMTAGYIGSLSVAADPTTVTPQTPVALTVSYQTTLYCPTFYFRIYGKYPSQSSWELRHQASFFVHTGFHSFSKVLTIPEPPTQDDRTYTFIVVGQSCSSGHPGCGWPTPTSYEKKAEVTVTVSPTIDLKVESKDISLSNPKKRGDGFKVVATVHNEGKTAAKNVKVRIVDTYLGTAFNEYTKIVSSILGNGETAKVTGPTWYAWDMANHKYVVTVDPDNAIQEADERNNQAETHLISGRVTNSDGEPLIHLKVEYVEKSGTDWVVRYTDYSNWDGRYAINANLEAIKDGAQGKMRARLEYSPNDDGRIKFRFYDDALWDAGHRDTYSQDSAEWTMDKSKDYSGQDVSFSPQQGGRMYNTLVPVSEFFKTDGRISFEPPNMDIEFMDDDYAGHTSYLSGDTIHMWRDHVESRHVMAHEYSHRVSAPWTRWCWWYIVPFRCGLPYNPIDENWANFGGTLSRGTSHVDFWGIDLQDDSQTDSSWNLQLAGVMWDLSADHDIATLRNDVPQTVREFYDNYRHRDSTRTATQIRQIFANHGYDVSGWPTTTLGVALDASALNGAAQFTDLYTHTLSDADSDGRWDSLNVSVGLSIATGGEYEILGFLRDSSGKSCFTRQLDTFNTGIYTAPLAFDGLCVYQKALTGTYSLAELYLQDTNNTLLDHRDIAYVLPQSYNYTDFERPIVVPTAYGERVEDTDSDSQYNTLDLDIGLDVTEPVTVFISGMLYDNSGNPLTSAHTRAQLITGVQTVTLRFNGADLYATGYSGAFSLRSLSIERGEAEEITSTRAIYVSDPQDVLYVTGVYSYTQFEHPDAAFVGGASDQAWDTDGDGLYNYLTVEATVNVSVTNGAGYTVLGDLYRGEDRVTSAQTSITSTGLQTVTLDFEGIAIRRSRLDDPYDFELSLRDDSRVCTDGSCLAGTLGLTGTTSTYNYTDFQLPPEEYFSIAYSDHGTDTDGDGLYNYLTVDLNVSTLVSGTYRVTGRLDDPSSNPVAYAQAGADLTAIPQTVRLNFRGQDLWRAGITDSSYHLSLEIDADNGERIIQMSDVYTTSAYAYTQFDPPDARFIGSYADAGTDTDSDGLYDRLDIAVGVDVGIVGDYRVQASLTYSDGVGIVNAAHAGYLVTGTQTITLSFDGLIIRDSGADGPYGLSNLTLHNTEANRLDYLAMPYTTTAYSNSQFQQGGAISGTVLSGGSVVTGTYVLAEGRGRGLAYTDDSGNYRIAPLFSGTYTVTAYPPAERNLLAASTVVNVLPGQTTIANLILQPGGTISGTVRDTAGAVVPNVIINVTGPQDASAVTDANGQYIITRLAAGSYNIYATPPASAYLREASTTTSLSSGGTSIVDFTLQPAGGIAGRVTDANGQPVQAQIDLGGYEPPHYSTDENGYYSIPGLSPGDYTLHISSDPPYNDWWIFVDGRHADNGTQVSISVVEGKTTVVDFCRPPTTPTADLYVDKSLYSGVVGFDEEVQYHVRVRNLGNLEVTGIVVTDTLPAVATYVAETHPSDFTTVITGSQTVWTKGSLAAYGQSGYEANLYLTVHLADTLVAGEWVTNTLTSSSVVSEADYNNNVYLYAQTAITPTRDLQISKLLYSGTPVPGGDIQYRVYFYNNGNSAAPDVIITDTLPLSTTYVSDQDSEGFTTVITGSTVVWTNPSVPSGDSGYLYLTVHISDTLSGGETLTNTVQVSTSRPETDYTNNIYTDTRTVQPHTRDMRVTKSLYSGTPVPGNEIEYRIYYQNQGNTAASDIVITDTLPVSTTYVSDYNPYGFTTVITGNTVVWTKASVSGGEYGYLYLTTRLDETLREGDVLTNTAYITTSHLETDYSDNIYTDTQTVVAGTRDMYVYKSRYSGVVRPGKDIQYRIYYQNQGNSSAAAVIITDTLPISITYVSDDNTAGFTTVITGSTVVWTKPSVSSGESGYLYLTVRISDTVTTGEFLTNTVTISTSDEETDYSDNIYTDTQTVVPPSVDLYVRKTLSSGSATPASDVTYEIYYRNYGDDPAEDVVITDTLPSLMGCVSHSGAFTPTVLGNQVIWDLGTVPGEPDDGYYGYLYLTAHISDTTPVGTILTNTVEISTSTTETGTYSNSDTDVRTVIAPTPNLKIWKTGWTNLPRGSEATYQIHYQNYSWSPAPMTVLTDVLPGGLSFVSSSGPFTPTVSGNQIVWSLGTVPFWDVPGFDVTLDLTVLVSDTLAVGTMVTNTAIISTPFEVDPVDNVSVHGATVEEPYLDILVYKWRYSGVPVAGTNITYAIYYKNEGTIPAPNVILTDTLPEATSFVTSTTWGGEPVVPLAVTDEYVTWDFNTMDPGEQDWLKVTIHISDGVPVGTTITNTAEIATSEEETYYGNNLNTEILTTVDPNPDLTVRKYFREGAFIPGGEVSYGIYYYNEGGAPVTNVLITDTLPVATTFITSTQWGLPITPITVTDECVIWDVGMVEPLDYQGEIYVYMQISDTVAAGTILTNTVEVQGDQEESDYTNNVSTHVATVETPSRDLRVYKWLDEGAPVAGQLITYAVYVDNEGNFPASNVVVTDTLPLPISYMSDHNYYGFTTVITGNTVVWTKDSLSGNSSAWLYLVGYISDTVPIATVLTNTVQVSTSDEETDYTDNVYIDTLTTIDPRADMRVYKNALGGAPPGGSFTYELVYQNAGGSPAANVVITDTLPEGTVYLACLDCLLPTVEGNQLVWNLDAVPPSQWYYWLGAVMVEVSETVTPGAVLTNVIEVSTTSEESDYTNNVYNLAITVPEPFSKTASILIVLDYGGYDTGWFASYYTGALDALGCPYDVWDTGLRGTVYGDTLNLYTNGVVIWAVPYWGYLNDWDVWPDIEDYLDAGGKLFITGQNVAQNLNGTTLFSDYLHASYVQNDTNLYALNGTTGDPIGDGLALGISGGDGANNQYDTDEIDPISPAVAVFTYDTAAATALAEPVRPEVTRPKRGGGEPGAILIPAPWGEPQEPPEKLVEAESEVGLQGIISSGTGSLRVDTGTYKVVFFSFGFEGINSAGDRAVVMERVLAWLQGVLPRPTQLSPANGSTAAPGDVNFTWSSVTGASGYQIQIDTADTFDSPVLISDTVTSTNYTATLTPGTWYWRVRALPDGSWTTAWELRVVEQFILTGKRIQIPRIDKEEGWDTRIQIQNVGDARTGLITLFWGDYSSACPPSAPGPVAHLCHRIPGSWGIQAVTAEIPAGAKSAIVYSVSDDLFQAACEAAGNYGAWASWEDTYAYSGEPLAVTVNRLASNGSSASGMYNGFSETMLGPDPYPPYRYFATNIMHGYDNFDSTITIQNSGELCTSVWLYYKEEGNCEYMTAQHIDVIAPGEAIRIGMGPDAHMPFPTPQLDAPWLGSAYITASEPLAVVVDRWDADSNMLLAHAGVPYPEYGATTNYAPLVYRDLDGWNAEIHVQNLTQKSEPTFVTVEFFDQSGDSILFVGDWVCRNGTNTFYLSDLVDLGVNFPFGYVGAAEIQSHEHVDYPGEQHPGEPIASVVSLINSNGSEAWSYSAFTPQQVTGVTTFAVPLISKQAQNLGSDIVKQSNGVTSKIFIRNNSNCNKIRGKLLIIDETGVLVGTIDVAWLHPKHLKIIDLAYQGWLPTGFIGAATFEVLEVEQLCDVDNDGYVDNEPIMSSVVVLNRDPGDSASGQEAFPIRDGPGVVVVGMVPSSPVKAETVEFEVTFRKQMNTAVVPMVAIGTDTPYTDYIIAPKTGTGYTNGYLDSYPTKWHGTYTFTKTMGDGVYRISIAGAEDSFGNPIATNTRNMFILDTIPPSSSVTDLPTYQPTLSFPVSWSGSDATSGITSYDVQYRDGAGSWTDWLTETVETSATFTGENRHTYYFQSRARDNAGNVEDYPGGDGDAHLCVLFGDFDPNGLVDVADIMKVASRWRMTDEDPDWDPRYDLNGDGIITVVDIMLVVKHWGETCG